MNPGWNIFFRYETDISNCPDYHIDNIEKIPNIKQQIYVPSFMLINIVKIFPTLISSTSYFSWYILHYGTNHPKLVLSQFLLIPVFTFCSEFVECGKPVISQTWQDLGYYNNRLLVCLSFYERKKNQKGTLHYESKNKSRTNPRLKSKQIQD